MAVLHNVQKRHLGIVNSQVSFDFLKEIYLVVKAHAPTNTGFIRFCD